MKDAAGQILEIDLVDDADAGRDDAEGLERLLAPLEELVALAVALELHVEVELHRVGPAVVVDLDGVIDDEIDGNKRLDDAGLAAETGHGAAHRGEIDQEGNPGEVLKDDAGNDERNLLGRGRLRIPCGEGANILLMNLAAVAVAEHGLEHHADGEGETGDLPDALLLECREGVVGSCLSLGGLEAAECLERVGGGHGEMRLLGF